MKYIKEKMKNLKANEGYDEERTLLEKLLLTTTDEITSLIIQDMFFAGVDTVRKHLQKII